MKKVLCGRVGVVFSLLLLLAVNISLSLAQLPTATILGVVKDSSEAVVPGATVTARNLETGQSRTGSSSADGSYRFPALLVGRYEIRAEHPGFQTEVRSGVTLSVGQEAVIDFALQVGGVEQTVSVAADAELVNTTTASVGALVNEQQVADLPLNGRNYVDLTLLQPGVNRHVPLRTSSTGVGTWFSANGAPLRSNYYLLDGAPMGNSWGASSSSAGSTTLGVEGIREWRVVTGSYSAEYGMRMGSQVMMVSKGGTNTFHGSLYEYLRNSALDARNFFDYKTAAASWRLPPFRRNQFGASAGGPLKKDQAFFFASYEGLRERLGLSNIINVLPAAAKLDPQIAAVMKPLVALFPDPNLPGDRYTYPASQSTDDNHGQIRGDYTFSNNDMFFARYTNDTGDLGDQLEFPQFKRFKESTMHFATFSDTHIFSPALLGTFRFSLSKSWLSVTSPSGIQGPQYSFLEGKEIGEINIGGITRFGPEFTAPNSIGQSLFTGSGDLYFTRGPHTLKFGTLINRVRQTPTNSLGLTGQSTFTDVASFLRGITSLYNASTPGSIITRTYAYNTFGFYLQDDFRTTANFTLNLGLRYEFNTTFNELDNHASVLRDVVRDAAYTVGSPFRNPSRKNISPRFGFAWDVRGDGKTALRGGLALLYDTGDFGNALYNNGVAMPPFSTRSEVRNSPLPITMPWTFPPGAVGNVGRTMNYNVQNAHMLHYHLTVERELPLALVVSVAYAGSRGFNLVSGGEVNVAIPQIQSDGRFFWSATGLPRVNPKWASLTYYDNPGNSWYNSLQVVVNKRLSQGLQFQSAYTWSKVIDENTRLVNNDSGGGSTAGDHPWLRSTRRGLTDFNLAHTWRFNAIYRLPERSAWKGFAGALLNGWWMSGILSAQTGRPFAVTLSSNRSRSGLGSTDRPDLVAGRTAKDIILGGPERYFDPLAFSIPAAGYLGNLGRNILTGPGLANLDFSLAKDTALRVLGESGKVEFRAEFFNILNRANFGYPSNDVYAGRANVEAPLTSAGRINSTHTTSRQVQFALKVLW